MIMVGVAILLFGIRYHLECPLSHILVGYILKGVGDPGSRQAIMQLSLGLGTRFYGLGFMLI